MENNNSNNDNKDTNKGFSDKHIDKDVKSQDSLLNKEIEVDKDGKERVVDRARNVDGSIASIPDEERTWNENESMSRGVITEEEAMNTVENEDRNSDITAKRYPNSHLDNHKNRGNMKLNEE
ncbi:hypothetical protein HNP99_001695 [Flavobacterium sp. 28A]|uniref:hypothetical protein n=1 Tax=Flavobacterium sp. 28A TaxID=2735895 RepID=UPI0015711C32|nr:hypothetical protein [Flavobacterium sp. 28A]NRT15348.1 hypothetical protein [Flavobacterium sp. 28A]